MIRAAAIVATAFLVVIAGGGAADTFAVRLVSQDNNTITLGWDPQPGYGYLFSSDGQLVSRTNDPNRATVRFSKATSYDIDVIVKGANGHYPAPTPPPPPTTARITQTITSGQTLAGVVPWFAVYDSNGDGTEEDPGSVQWYVDGVIVRTEVNVPFGDDLTFWPSASVPNGNHTFEVRAVSPTNVVLATNSVTATVSNGTPPPPPPPPPTTGFPNATTTGVPAGTNLTAYTGPTNITTPGAVIDSKTITGCLTIQAAGVIIRNSRIMGGGCFFVIEVFVSGASLTISDSEIDCQSTGETALAVHHTTAIAMNIHHCENGVDITNFVTIRDSYIHDGNGPGPDPHIDGIQASWGADSLIEHNTILSRDTSSIIVTNYNNHPTVDNTTINNNLMGAQTSASVAYVIYCPSAPTTNFRVTNNHFLSQFPPVGGYSTGCSRNGIIQSGNVIQETGQPINLP